MKISDLTQIIVTIFSVLILGLMFSSEGSACQDDDSTAMQAEKLGEEVLAGFAQFQMLLKKLDDKYLEQSSFSELQVLSKKTEPLLARWEALESKLSADERRQVETVLGKRWEAQRDALVQEWVRLGHSKTWYSKLHELKLFQIARNDGEYHLQKSLEKIYRAIQVFEVKTGGEELKSILELTKKRDGMEQPLLSKEEALDPWGREYQFDPKGPKHEGKKMDVWSQGPPAASPPAWIGNWTKQP